LAQIYDNDDNFILAVEEDEVFLAEKWSRFVAYNINPILIISGNEIYLKKDYPLVGMAGDPIAVVRGNKVFDYSNTGWNDDPIARVDRRGKVWDYSERRNWNANPIAITDDEEIMSGAAAAVFLLLMDGEAPEAEDESKSSIVDEDSEEDDTDDKSDEENSDDDNDEDDEDEDSSSYEPGSNSSSYTPGYRPTSSAPVQATSNDSPAFIVLILIALIFIGVDIVRRSHEIPSDSEKVTESVYIPPPKTPPSQIPPLQIVDENACPFEGCRYGEDWVTLKDANIYFKLASKLGTADWRYTIRAKIPPNTWMKTLGGVVIARAHKGKVNLKDRPRTEYGIGHQNERPLIDGEGLILYSDLGESCYRAWLDNHFIIACNPQTDGQPIDNQEWWVRVRLSDNSEAWIKPDNEIFTNREGLNEMLSSFIGNDKMTLQEKIAKIDNLISLQSDVNGLGAYLSGNSPIDSVIMSRNVDLFEVLVARGLDLRLIQSQPNRCLDYPLQSIALEKGGDLMLRALIKNGLSFRCFKKPVIYLFISWGIGSDLYIPRLEQLELFLNVLLENGIDIGERDMKGFSAIDLVSNQAQSSNKNFVPNLQALKDLLDRIGKKY
jgi:hypothetical protein